jgi:uncharacterized protein YgiM (DUF1202 family)
MLCLTAMRFCVLAFMLGVAMLSAGFASAGHHQPAGHQRVIIAVTRHDGVVVRRKPSVSARPVATLPADTQVELLSHKGKWSHIRIWATTLGWTWSSDLIVSKPWSAVSHYAPPALLPPKTYAAGPFPLHVGAVAEQQLTVLSLPNGAVRATIKAGQRFTIDAWRQDRGGLIWYHTRSGWVTGEPVRFLRLAGNAEGNTSARLVSGKGMWLTEGTVAHSDPWALVRAAQQIGLSHLYVEFADSPLGLYATEGLDGLLVAAHSLHIAVIAWVFPYLQDVAADVFLTRRVATYQSASGQRFDGIAVDLEDHIHLWNVRAYSQLVRAYLPHELIIGVVWPPQAFPNYPYQAVAESDDVLAPMDYWHDRQGSTGWAYPSMRYGYSYADRFARDSIVLIHTAVGSMAVPIAPIGQMFDDFSRNELGPNAPTAAEIAGFLHGCQVTGAWGVSFFQWMTATPAEWQVFKAWHSP